MLNFNKNLGVMKMKKISRRINLIAALIIALVSILSIINMPFTKQAQAATIQGESFIEKFDSDTVGDDWQLKGDVAMSDGTYRLRINAPNEWQPALKPHMCNITDSADIKGFYIEYDFEYISGGGWLGTFFGTLAKNAAFYDAGVMFMMDRSGSTSVWKGSGSNLVVDDSLQFNATQPQQGDVYTYRIEGYRIASGIDEGRYNLKFFSGIKGSALTENKNAQAAYAAEAVIAAGHFGFTSMGTLIAEISRFDYELYNLNDEVVQEFKEDFSSPRSKICYPSDLTTLNDCDWYMTHATSKAPESSYYMGIMKELKFENSKDGKIVSSNPLSIDTRVDRKFEIKYDLYYENIDEGAYFGLGLGLDSQDALIDSQNLIYMTTVGGTINLGVLKNGQKSQNTPTAVSIPDDKTSVEIKYIGYYNLNTKKTDVDIYIKDIKAGTFSDINFDGYYAVGAKGTDFAKVNLLIDNLTLTQDAYIIQDRYETIDFLGTEIRKAGNETLVAAWYNQNKWTKSGIGVNDPRRIGATNYHYLEFKAPANTTSSEGNMFGPSEPYGDYVFRYTLQVKDPDSSWIGISFAKPNMSSLASASPLIKFERDGDGMVVKGENGLKTASGQTSYKDTSTTFFDTAKSFDVMMIAQSGIVSIYYCEAGTNSSYEPKITFVDVDTYGLIGLTADLAGGHEYIVTAMSITNIDDYYEPNDEDINAANISDDELNDRAQIAFETGFINPTRWKINGDNIAISDKALKFNNTKKSAYFSTIGKFKNYQLNFDLTQKSNTSDIVITFGKTSDNPVGNKIVFKADTPNIELIGMQTSNGQVLTQLPINIFEIDETLNIKVTVLGNTVKLFVKKASEPISALSVPVMTMSIMESHPYEAGAIAFSTGDNGDMTIDNIRILSLNYNIDMITEHKGGSNKPELSDLSKTEKKGCAKGCASANIIFLLIPMLFVGTLTKR